MKDTEKLQDAIGMTDPNLVKASEKLPAKEKTRKQRLVIKWASPIAAVLVLALAVTIIFGSGSPFVLKTYAIYEAEYPEVTPYPNTVEQMFAGGSYDDWAKDNASRRAHNQKALSIGGFTAKATEEILSGTDGENRIYSPLNIYIALAMLAETAGGNTRDELLALLGMESIDDLRTQVNHLWLGNYQNDGAVTSILANSIWLDKGVSFNKDTLLTLANTHRASSYAGEMGSDGFNKALQAWLSEQTGGLLDALIQNIELDPKTLFSIASTVYFEAKWDSKFSKDKNKNGTFHGASGDESVTYMNATDWFGQYYWGNTFSATRKALEGSGNMYFLLPDEGITIDEMLADPETQAFLANPNGYENNTSIKVHLSVPKFDAISGVDLADAIKALGADDAFSLAEADFSSLTDEDLYVSSVLHGARVQMDEDGVKATSYTVIPMAGSPAPPEDEVYFTVDRPFAFFITGDSGDILFVGVINTIE